MLRVGRQLSNALGLRHPGQAEHGLVDHLRPGSECRNLPGFVVIDTGMVPPGGLDLFGARLLPANHQGMLFRKGTTRWQTSRYGHVNETEASIANYEIAFRMQSEVPDLLDFSRESKATLNLYGFGAAETDEFGRACLIARRMVRVGRGLTGRTNTGRWSRA